MLTGVSGEGRSYREQNHRAGISQMEERVMQILKTGQGIHRGVSGGKKKGAEIHGKGEGMLRMEEISGLKSAS
jgi:hypothetical protein